MKTKNLMVFFLTIVSVLAIASLASAFTTELATIDSVKVNGIYDFGNEDISVIAGETIEVQVIFTALEDASDVKVEVEVEGEKQDADVTTQSFTVENGLRYVKTLVLRVPYELNDDVSEDMALNLKLWNGDFKTEHPEITLRVQRPSYNAGIMSISSSQTVEAGDLFPVDIAIKNTGYNDLDNLYVTAKIIELGIEKTAYFGDLVAIDDDNDDSESKRFYLQIPYDAQNGIYSLEVEVENNDLIVTEVKQIYVQNDFSSNVIVESSRQVVAANQDAEYNLVLVNPTNKLKVYRVIVESSGDLSTSPNTALVSVPAGSSKTFTVTANAASEGEYSFNVNVFSGEELVSTTALTLNADGNAVKGSIVALTIILVIVFLVLLAVLVVLLRKKSDKPEEFGESYY